MCGAAGRLAVPVGNALSSVSALEQQQQQEAAYACKQQARILASPAPEQVHLLAVQ
jgi:hypothetical protein